MVATYKITCDDVIKSAPQLVDDMPFSRAELSRALCRASEYQSEPDITRAIRASRQSRWDADTISKKVSGGLQHVISADNAAGYAELWHRGGNWYAVTGADLDGNILKKSTEHWQIYELTSLRKGMGVEQATARFLESLFGAQLRNGKDCGCKAQQKF